MMDGAFAPQLTRLDARIAREIQRLRARYQLSLDEFRGLYVSDEHVDRLLGDGGGISFPEPLPRPAAGLCESVPRWRRLVDTFALGPLDEDLLLIATAPEMDLKYETLYAYLNDDVTRKWPTADLARRLLADVGDVSTTYGAIAEGGTLHARHLVRRIEPPAARPGLRNVGYALHPCVAYWLHGEAPALAIDPDAVRWFARAELPPIHEAARSRAERIVRLLGPRAGTAPIVALVGRDGSGRASTAVAVAAAAGRPLVRVDVGVGDDATDADEVLERLSLALALEPAVVLVEGFETAASDEQRFRSEARVRRAFGRWPASTLTLLRVGTDDAWRGYAGGRRVVEVRCDADTFPERVAQWRTAARLEAVSVPDVELESLAGRFALTPGHVRATLATARDLATMGGTTTVETGHITAAARLASDQALGRLATKVERAHDWADLVLPPATLRRLHELAAAIRLRHVVYDAWGFGERLVEGTGIKALFAGASGTGKTMAAGVIARELALDLYKIDLSGIVSKYIGETEKNLDRIFRAARAANAIVFLDEAEAIMGKRSEVKDAHDRYANIEVAYLLQKLEEHDGIVILATNLKRNIDDAFNRRVQYVIDFPRPNEGERLRLWRGMFPSRCPLGPDVDFAFLARGFDLAGGDIRNVALDAAFLAAQDGGTIGMRVVVDALARQLAKQGKTPTGSEFRQYQGLLPRTGG